MARKQYEHRRKEAACVNIQSGIRTFLAMKTYGALYCSIIRMQASIRGMAMSNLQINKKLAGAPFMSQV